MCVAFPFHLSILSQRSIMSLSPDVKFRLMTGIEKKRAGGFPQNVMSDADLWSLI